MKNKNAKLYQQFILLAIILALILIPLTFSAGETVVYYKNNETISIKSSGATVMDLQLIENTYQCKGTYCYAIFRIIPKINLNTALTSTASSYNWTFRQDNKDGKTLSIPYKLYSNTTDKNGSMQFTKPAELSNFNFESGKTYYFKLEGTIPRASTIEWIPVFYGFTLDEWTTWTAGGDLPGYAGVLSCNSTNYMTGSGESSTAYNETLWSLSGSELFKYTGFVSEAPEEIYGGPINNTDMWYINYTGRVIQHNLGSGAEIQIFNGGGLTSPTGITNNMNGIDGTPTIWYIIYKNGTLIKYNSAWVQQQSWNITDIVAPSTSGAGTNFFRTITYNQSDFWVGTVNPPFIYHLSSAMTNITDGFNTSSGTDRMLSMCINSNQTIFAQMRDYADSIHWTRLFYSELGDSVISALNSPANATNSTSTNIINFTVTSAATGAITLGSVELFVYNATSKGIYYSNIKTITGKSNQTSWELTLPLTATSEEYIWNARVNSSDNALAIYDINRTLWIDLTSNVISTLVSPINDSDYLEGINVSFICDGIASMGIGSITFRLYNYTGSLMYSNIKTSSGTTYQKTSSYIFNNNGTYNWNCQVNNSDNSLMAYDVNRTININVFGIDNCTIGTMPALRFSLIDEQNSSKINGTVESTFIYWSDSSLANGTYSAKMEGNNSYIYCIYPDHANFTSNARIKYSSPGYSTRYFLFDNNPIDNATEQIWLRMLENSSITKFFVNVRNVDDTVVRNAIVNIYKFYDGEGIYKIIGAGKTDYYGEFVTWLEQDIEHLFAIYINGINIKNQTYTTICTEIPCTINLKLGPEAVAPFEQIQDIPGFYFSLSYDKIAKNVSLVYTSDPGTLNNVILSLKQFKAATNDIVVCNRTSTAEVDALGCDVSNVTTGQFGVYAYITTTTGKVFVRYLSVSIDTRFQTFGKEGIFWAIGLLIVIVFTGLWNPSVAMMLTLVGFGLLAAFGIIGVSYTALIVVIIIGMIYIILMRS